MLPLVDRHMFVHIHSSIPWGNENVLSKNMDAGRISYGGQL